VCEEPNVIQRFQSESQETYALPKVKLHFGLTKRQATWPLLRRDQSATAALARKSAARPKRNCGFGRKRSEKNTFSIVLYSLALWLKSLSSLQSSQVLQ